MNCPFLRLISPRRYKFMLPVTHTFVRLFLTVQGFECFNKGVGSGVRRSEHLRGKKVLPIQTEMGVCAFIKQLAKQS